VNISDVRLLPSVHTHVYPPSYIEVLKSRAASRKIPYVIAPAADSPDQTHRLVILPGEDDPSTPSTARGRPVGPVYWDIAEKIAFMDRHSIAKSVISLANPWLDFLDTGIAAEEAVRINDEIDGLCGRYPGRLYAFGSLPLSAEVGAVVEEVRRLTGLESMRGIILGTSGLGEGLDDPKLDPIYEALAETGSMIFLHPHYGLPTEVFGPRKNDYGHVLPLALGFPLETTIAVTRMYLSGVFDRFPKLQVLLAHSGGTLPFLAGRIESCIEHDAHFMRAMKEGKRKSIWETLKQNIWLDAVVYSQVGLKAAVEASGAGRVMFGALLEPI
jgi:predicted TIM-barrel fold metal-dependent hydrolase